jgi:HSP20 family protein
VGSLMRWTGITSFKQELDRLFDRVGEPTGQEFSALSHGAPSLDVSDTKEAFVVKFSMPGMDANDIQLSLQENVLTIKGERKQEKEDTGRGHRVERSHGTFIRSVGFPRAVDASRVTANCTDGMLTVTLPKTSTTKETSIPIRIE